MTDQVLHYSNRTTNARQSVQVLRHLQNVGCLVASDITGQSTYAGLRANIALHVPPAVHSTTIDLVRDAIGDGVSIPGTLGRLSLNLGATLDALVATAAAATGTEIDTLCSGIAAYTAPDTVPGTLDSTFEMQV